MTERLLYIAAPLFSSAEKKFNVELATLLEAQFRVFLPQRDGQLLVDLIGQGVNPTKAKNLIFEADIAAIRQCAALVAVLDGRTIDEGVAFELGFAYCLGKTCVGLQTDSRRLLAGGNNPMIDRSLSASYQTSEQLLRELTRLCQ